LHLPILSGEKRTEFRDPCEARVGDIKTVFVTFHLRRFRFMIESRRPHPTEPSIWSWINLFISKAYSIGSSLTSGSMKPATIYVAD
jgi:hypothetical protein